MPPCKGLAMLEILQIMLMGIRFPFEGDATISIAFSGVSDKPLHYIPEVESYDEHFQHLACVDALMVHHHRIHLYPFARKDNAKEIDGIEPLERYEAIADNHFFRE